MLADYFETQQSKILKEIKEKNVISEDLKKQINSALETFRSAHAEVFTLAK